MRKGRELSLLPERESDGDLLLVYYAKSCAFNPVVTGFVTEVHYWKYSSAIDYSGEKSFLEIDFV